MMCGVGNKKMKKLSGLQELFYQSKFAPSIGDNALEKEFFMTQSFPTDYHVLKYLLEDVLQNALGICRLFFHLIHPLSCNSHFCCFPLK
jgi:hypothetical protein